MDRKRKHESIEGEGVTEFLPLENDLITSEELESILSADDYKQLQENIEKGKIKDVNMTITADTDISLLMMAGEAGAIECVKVLLANNADVNYTDYYERSAVTSAAESGNTNLLLLILSRDELEADLVYEALHDPLCSGSSAFELSTEVAELLISRLPDVNRKVNGECLLLNHAARGAYLNIVSMLLESGSDPNLTDCNGVDALYAASMEGRFEVIKLLIEFDSPHKISMESINKGYLCACYEGCIEIVSYLIEKGADISATEDNGGPAIDYAIHNNNIPLAKLLIENGFNVNLIYYARSALHFACVRMYDEMAKLLLDSGADPDLRYPDGSSLLLRLVTLTCDSQADYTPYITLLLDRGANVNLAYERTGQTALMIAGSSANIDMVKLLLDHDADPNIHYPDGSSLLLKLVMATCDKHGNYFPYITLLLNHGANVNIAHSVTGQTALMTAAQAQDVDLVKLLLEHGADVTQVNKEGKSVLDMLGRTRSHAKVAELCHAYVDCNRVDSKAILK